MASQSDNQSCIVHIMVVGFHHQYGAEVEFVYPPLIVDTLKKNESTGIPMPDPWQDLPNLCIPDGAHTVKEDATFFHVPDIDDKGIPTTGTLYGVSHYRSIETKDLINKDESMTRTEVKKSVCILSKVPLYMLILSKLEVIIRTYFEEKDFTKTSILEDAFKSLTQTISWKMLDKTYINAGLSVRDTFKRFKGKLVSLFKLLLLEKKVLFYGSPVRTTCRTMLSALSLIPGVTELLIPRLLTCQMAKISCKWHDGELSADEYGLPLEIFHQGVVFQPYVSLQQMDLLRDKRAVHSFIAGATNILFLRHSFAHAVVYVEKGVIEVRDPSLTRALSLTTEDLRFTEYLSQYITSKFSAKGNRSDASHNFEILTDFNHTFVNQWKATDSYHKWKSGSYTKLDDVPVGHPFKGSYTLSDVKMRLSYQLQDVQLMDQEQSKKLNQAVSNTGKAVGGALASAKSKVTNWWFKGNDSSDSGDRENSTKEYIRAKDIPISATEGDEHERQELLPDKPQQVDAPDPFVVDDDDEDIDIDVLLSRGTTTTTASSEENH
ncbi:Late secretory pathway protein AVL9-like protein [Trichoplax sp. H2]|nr:Late secretory pathway protein AVL9-like protein [Trichoplax sp. H2]|eukprot:RDD42672.1 Late secretory pathway protein AVL9-like protein [Trichoplax sp. H2]